MRKTTIHKSEAGQAWVILAVTIAILIIMLGFAIDSAILFSNYTKLKRAVDAAAVAASNEYKVKNAKETLDSDPDPQLLLAKMKAAAQEMLTMHDLDMAESKIKLEVYICDGDGNGLRDDDLETLAPNFFNMCPVAPKPPRKLVYVQASEEAPTYFMSLIGINSIPLTTNSISEAAPIDLVLVIDTSESMGFETVGYVADDFDPNKILNPATGTYYNCNTSNSCQPLQTAKDAASHLIDTLYTNYDRVAIVTFNQVAVTRFALTDPDAYDMAKVKAKIDLIPLHEDAPARRLYSSWYNGMQFGKYNLANPEDRDGNGMDADPGLLCQVTPVDVDGNYDPSNPTDPLRWLLQDKSNYLAQMSNPSIPFVPCDKDNKLDAFDWDQNGWLDASDVQTSDNFVEHYCIETDADGNCTNSVHLPMATVSTCTGCGIRVATANLTNGGRSNAVWVMVVLSDGVANMTDTPDTFPVEESAGIPTIYPNGYCGGSVDNPLWTLACRKQGSTRICINPTLTPLPNPPAPTPIPTPFNACPPFSVTPIITPAFTYVTPPYSPIDYAMDMVDRAALLKSSRYEPLGSDMAIYSIGLGNSGSAGAGLLRYMAAVGDDGDRTTDPCSLVLDPKVACGQYYFAQNANELGPIFDSIASRIYTKITY